MRYRVFAIISMMLLLLSGCASTQKIQSDVTVFQDWPANVQGQRFAFERTEQQANDLERRAYENLVRNELVQVGLSETSKEEAADIKVALSYGISARDVRIVEPVIVDPFWHERPFHRSFFYPHWHGFYRPFHDPFWHGMPLTEYRSTNFEIYKRHLKITLSRASDGKPLYDVTVISEGTNGSLAAVMPYMVRSAFADFPAKNGVSRRIVLDMKE